jgi:acetyltransferase
MIPNFASPSKFPHLLGRRIGRTLACLPVVKNSSNTPSNTTIASNVNCAIKSLKHNSPLLNNNRFSFYHSNCAVNSYHKKGVDLDQVQEVLIREVENGHPLDKFFKPKSIVVIGASEKQGFTGRTILWNLMSCRLVKVYPIHAGKETVMGLTAYPSVNAIFKKLNISSIDLAVICTPKDQLLSSVEDCIKAGIKAAVLVNPDATSTSFAASKNEEEENLYKKIKELARQNRMRILGPDCLGVMSPSMGPDGRVQFINATYIGTAAIPGRIAVISQSSEMGLTVLDWGLKKSVGFSAFLSLGSMLDISWGDLIEYYGRDDHTDAILLYMESIGSIENARKFINAARTVALKKPIILIKVGRTNTYNHMDDPSRTASLIHSDKVLDTIFERCGVLRVDTIEDLFNMAQVLSKQPRPKSNRIGLISNSRSAAMLAVDSLIGRGELSQFSKETLDELSKCLPKLVEKKNPLDILPDAKPEHYVQAMQVLAKDPNVDAILTILTPQDHTEPTRTAQFIKEQFSHLHVNASLNYQPVILTCWMGGLETEAGRDLLVNADIPSFIFPDTVVQVFNYMWRYSKNLETLYEIPSKNDNQDINLLPEVKEENVQKARSILQNAVKSNTKILNEHESKAILELYGIPISRTFVCYSVEDAQRAAKSIGYPVVMKLHSDMPIHKLEIDAVKLNIQDEETIRRCFNALKNDVEKHYKDKTFEGVTIQPMVSHPSYHSSFELILGSTYDNQYGPILLFGSGGGFAHVHEDVSLAIPPLTKALARRMIRKTRIYRVLEGYRMKAGIDMTLLQEVLMRFSQLVTDLSSYIKAIDINPIKISSVPLLGLDNQKIAALDVRIFLHSEEPKDIAPVIRSYPSEYVSRVTLRNGDQVTIRPLRFEDHPTLVNFFGSLSKEQLELSSKEEALNYENSFYNLKKQQEQMYKTKGVDEKPEVLQLQNDPFSKEIYMRMVQMCIGDYSREIVLAAELNDKFIAIGRYTVSPSSFAGHKVAEIAVLVGESHQRHGVGQVILSEVIKIAKQENINELVANIHSSNIGMQMLTKKLGFKVQKEKAPKSGFVRMSLEL